MSRQAGYADGSGGLGHTGNQMGSSNNRAPSGRNNSEGSESQFSSGSISHRQRFEDERKRIESSLFARLDDDGKPLEAYITHVRAIEDAVFPSAPPPPDHPPTSDTKKSRVIIIAVRRSGRVRMHKARENTNGSFSIGKSWYLDDLISIEDHSSTGFVVTIVKPYYWQTPTPREKDAFLATLIRVYKKYTGGREPRLIGFNNTSFMGGSSGPVPPQGHTSGPSTGASGSATDTHQRDVPPPQRAGRPQQLNLQQQQPLQQSSLGPGPALQPPRSPLPSLPQGAGSPMPSPRPPPPQDVRPPPTPRGGPPSLGRHAGANAANAARQPSPVDGVFNAGLNGSSSSLQAPGLDQIDQRIPPRKPITHDSKPSMASLASSSGSVMSNEGQSLRRPSEGSSDSRPFLGSGDKAGSRSRPAPTEPIRPQIDTAVQNNPSQTSLTGERSPSALSPPDILGFPKKKSAKDVASQFRLAASAYAVGGALSSLSSRSKSPQSSTLSPPPPKSPVGTASDAQPASLAGNKGMEIVTDSRQQRSNSFNSQDDGSGSVRLRSPTITGLRDGVPEKSSRRSESPVQRQTEPLKRSDAKPPQIHVQTQNQNQNLGLTGSMIESSAPPLIQEPKAKESRSNKHDSLIFDTSEEQLSVLPQEGDDQLSSKSKKRRSMAAVTARNRFLSTVDTTNMTVDLNALLDEFKWDGRTSKVSDLEANLKKELAKVESGNVWLSSAGTNHELHNKLMGELEAGFDEMIQRCEDIDGLFTLYAVELMSLQDDIAYIENQSQGLQVQTANQKTLQRELVALLETITISPQEIETLQGAKIQGDGLVQIENALAVLYKAMLTIDPTLGSQENTPEDSVNAESLTEAGMGKMVALRDKKEKYERDSKAFLGRFVEYMKIKYQQDLMLIEDSVDLRNPKKGMAQPVQHLMRIESHLPAFKSLYQFSALIMFAKDVDRSSYWQLVKHYQLPARDLYQRQFRKQVAHWKRSIKKPTPEDQGILFTHTEKETESVATTVRTITVKRSQTLAKTLRSPLGDNPKGEKANIDGKGLSSSEAFIFFLDEIVPLVVAEQNFLSEFFHMKASGSAPSFLEFVQMGTPGNRQIDDMDRRRVPEIDRNVARILNETMSEIFSFLGNELQSFIDAAIKSDPLQGVGILLSLERKINIFKDTTNQEFIVRLLIKNIDQLRGMFIKFLKEQVRAIEATKVKIKKRKGVIDFMRIFPVFSTRIEDQLPSEQTAVETLDIREMVNNGYSIIHRAMMDTLQAIAKQSPQGTSQSLDPEDKEQLNYHIMMIENMNHYVEEVEVRFNSVLQDFKQRADEEYKEHLGLYIGAVMRRPLGKLLDFIEGVEAFENTLSPEEILQRPSHNKLAFKKILGQFDAKEMREGIKTLGKRVDKHFSEGDDLNLAVKLVEKIMKALEAEYLKMTNRVSNLLAGIYRDSGLDMGWRRDDITAAFAKSMSKQQ